MSFSLDQLGPEWRITGYYVVVLIALVGFAKLVSAAFSREPLGWRLRFLFIAPMLSVDTWKRVRGATKHDATVILLHALASWIALASCYVWLRPIMSRPELFWPVRSYLAAIPFWLLTEAGGSAAQLIFVPFGMYIPTLHVQPWRSRSVAEFWGRRWNRVVGDWLRQVCFRPLRHNPSLALIVAFLISGLLHELWVNLPLWAAYGKNLFGSMFVYFLIQPIGILVERRWFPDHVAIHRAFVWLMVVGPLPLLLNEGTLRIFHFVDW